MLVKMIRCSVQARTTKRLHLLLGLALLCCSQLSFAAERYVSDALEIMMRSGPGNEYRITKTLRSGTGVKTLGERSDSGYIEVQLSDGRTGWVMAQYLMNEPSARQQLAQTREELAQLKAAANPAQAKMLKLEQENEQLKTDLNATEQSLAEAQRELKRVIDISGRAVELDSQNQTLMEKAHALQNQLDVVNLDNQRLSENHDKDFMLYGALAVVIGVIIALLVPQLTPKKRQSEWF